MMEWTVELWAETNLPSPEFSSCHWFVMTTRQGTWDTSLSIWVKGTYTENVSMWPWNQGKCLRSPNLKVSGCWPYSYPKPIGPPASMWRPHVACGVRGMRQSPSSGRLGPRGFWITNGGLLRKTIVAIKMIQQWITPLSCSLSLVNVLWFYKYLFSMTFSDINLYLAFTKYHKKNHSVWRFSWVFMWMADDWNFSHRLDTEVGLLKCFTHCDWWSNTSQAFTDMPEYGLYIEEVSGLFRQSGKIDVVKAD